MNRITCLLGLAVASACTVAPGLARAQSTPVEALNLFVTGLSQSELARAVGTLCAAGNRVSDRLQQDCNALVGSAFQGDGQVRTALRQIVADNVNASIDRSQFGFAGATQSIGGVGALRAVPPGLGFLPQNGALSYAASEDFGRWSVFGHVDIADFSRDRSVNEDGFDGDRQVFTIGMDRRFTDHFTAGLALGYGSSDLDFTGNSGNQDIDQTTLLLFGNWSGDNGMYFDALASWQKRETDQTRRVAYALAGGTMVDQRFAANFDADISSLAATLGYHWQREGFGLDPFLTVEVSSLEVDGYQETASSPTGNGAGWAIIAPDSDSDMTTLDLGLRASWVISRSNSVWLPQVEIAYGNIIDQDENTTAVRFVGDQSGSVGLSQLIFGLANDREDDDYYRVGLGMVAQWTSGRSGFVNLASRLGETGYDSTVLTLGMRFEF